MTGIGFFHRYARCTNPAGPVGPTPPTVALWLPPIFDYQNGAYNQCVVHGAASAHAAVSDGSPSSYLSGVPVTSYSGSPAGNSISLSQRVQGGSGTVSALYFGVTCVSTIPGTKITLTHGQGTGSFFGLNMTTDLDVPVGSPYEIFAGPFSMPGGFHDLTSITGGDATTFGYTNYSPGWGSGPDHLTADCQILEWRLGVVR